VNGEPGTHLTGPMPDSIPQSITFQCDQFRRVGNPAERAGWPDQLPSGFESPVDHMLLRRWQCSPRHQFVMRISSRIWRPGLPRKRQDRDPVSRVAGDEERRRTWGLLGSGLPLRFSRNDKIMDG